MLNDVAPTSSNRLLKALSADEYGRMIPYLKPVELPPGKVIYQADEPIGYVYFPDDSIISTITCFEDGNCIETAITGREGMLGLPVVLGNVESPRTAVVQSGGGGWRMPAESFLSVFKSGDMLRQLFMSYAFTFFEQVAQSGACINHHPVIQRLARWLLMCHDRTDGDDLHITHDFIAQMLGVNRPTVTTAAIILKDKRLVAYSRGTITILDRRGLEDASCECYESIKKIYDQYLLTLEMRHLNERMQETSDRMAFEIARRKTIQTEARERIGNLRRVVADIKDLPVRIRVCVRCQRFCDSHNRRSPAAALVGKRINAEFISIVCATCAGI